jgi:hypothetical protein
MLSKLISPISKDSKDLKKKIKKEREPPAWYLPPPTKMHPKKGLIPVPVKEFKVERPLGLYECPDAISNETRNQVLGYFENIEWIQRFGKQYPKTAHHNYHWTESQNEDELKQKYPEMYKAAKECFESMKAIVPEGKHPAFDEFRPETISVHKHAPNWGLGAHYDNSQDVGAGLVLMVNISTDDAVPREFMFTDPPGGRKFSVFTRDKMGVVFTGNAYDYYKHESVRNPKQSGICYSMTIRLKKVCGYGKKASDGLEYKPGAPAAEKVAHERIAAIRAAGGSY